MHTWSSLRSNLSFVEKAAGSRDGVCVDAAHVVTPESLSYSAESCCGCLSHTLTLILFFRQALLKRSAASSTLTKPSSTISRFGPSEPAATSKAAFARVFRAIAAACAALVGPAQWDPRSDSLPVREDAKLVLKYFSRYVPIDRPSRSTVSFCAARSSRYISPPSHGFDAIWLQDISCAVPWCGDPPAKLSSPLRS